MSEHKSVTSPTVKAINDHFPGRAHAMRRNSGRVKYRIDLGEAGTPDIEVMLRGGRTLWIETKTPEGELRPTQVTWHARARQLGHTVVIARSPQQAVNLVHDALRGRL